MTWVVRYLRFLTLLLFKGNQVMRRLQSNDSLAYIYNEIDPRRPLYQRVINGCNACGQFQFQTKQAHCTYVATVTCFSLTPLSLIINGQCILPNFNNESYVTVVTRRCGRSRQTAAWSYRRSFSLTQISKERDGRRVFLRRDSRRDGGGRSLV